MTIVKNLRTGFKSLVDNASWMDSAIKAIAKDKLDSMVANIGYPDWMTNKTALQIYYSKVRYVAFQNTQLEFSIDRCADCDYYMYKVIDVSNGLFWKLPKCKCILKRCIFQDASRTNRSHLVDHVSRYCKCKLQPQ